MTDSKSDQSKLFPATATPDQEWWAAVVAALGVTFGMSVVDLCCGDECYTVPLAKRVDGKIYALDMDPDLLDQAHASVAGQGVLITERICGDAK